MRFQRIQTQWRSVAAAACLGLPALAVPLPSHASLLTSTVTKTFSGSVSVTDQEGGGATSNSSAVLATPALQQFDPNAGVLMGARLNMASERGQSVNVRSTDGPNNGTNQLRTSSGSASSNAAITAPGVSSTFATLSSTDNCTASRLGACNDGATASGMVQTNLDGTVASASLGSYVGSSLIPVSLSAPVLSATQLSSQFTGNESTTNTLSWSGTVSLVYDYLLHAAPALGGDDPWSLILDFGEVYLGDSATLDFSLSNASGDRVGLDLDSVSGSGDTAHFNTDLSLFTNLLAANSLDFSATLNTDSTGEFTADYLLGLSDADFGAANSRHNYWLNLRMIATVVEQPTGDFMGLLAINDVPEPGVPALLGMGLLGLFALRRRPASV